MLPPQPVVLCLSGYDPTGGAGVQADIESIASMGAHAVSVITTLTAQNTINISDLQPVSADFFARQLDVLLEDVRINAIKIGMTASSEIIQIIVDRLEQLPHLPVVYDPVLTAGGGKEVCDENMLSTIREILLPKVTLLTPNSLEARRLSRENSLTEAGLKLMQAGCDSVLISGGHEDGPHIENMLFDQHRHIETFSWNRLPGEFHGSGCTLASASAALLARGLDVFNAVNEAQEYSWHSLEAAFRISEKGQLIPNRFFWQHADELD